MMRQVYAIIREGGEILFEVVRRLTADEDLPAAVWIWETALRPAPVRHHASFCTIDSDSIVITRASKRNFFLSLRLMNTD